MISAERRAARARIAANTRHHRDRPELVEADQTRLLELGLEQHIRNVVATAPPLDAATRDRLAALLRPRAGEAE